MENRFKASMVLSAVGDALGYKNGEWEFCYKGVAIHEELRKLGGLGNINVDKKNWRISDDTVLHIATAEALVSDWASKQQLFLTLAQEYKKAMVGDDRSHSSHMMVGWFSYECKSYLLTYCTDT
jgi:ADP-ribosylarginine hydrolase